RPAPRTPTAMTRTATRRTHETSLVTAFTAAPFAPLAHDRNTVHSGREEIRGNSKNDHVQQANACHNTLARVLTQQNASCRHARTAPIDTAEDARIARREQPPPRQRSVACTDAEEVPQPAPPCTPGTAAPARDLAAQVTPQGDEGRPRGAQHTGQQ